MTGSFDPKPVLDGLKDFQRQTVDYVFERLGPTMCHESPSSVRISTTQTEEHGLSQVNNVFVKYTQ